MVAFIANSNCNDYDGISDNDLTKVILIMMASMDNDYALAMMMVIMVATLMIVLGATMVILIMTAFMMKLQQCLQATDNDAIDNVQQW